MEGKSRRWLGAALLAIALSTPGSVARAAEIPTETVRVLVQFAPDTSDAEHAAAASRVGGTVDRELRAIGVTRIAAPIERGAAPDAILRALSREPTMRFAELDTRVRLEFVPNDPYWDTDPLVGLGQWGAKRIALDRALDVVGALAPVTVAVVDTGVDAGHPDLAGVVLRGRTFVTAQNDACRPDAIGSDDNSHGTHVAGIIAANANNGIGIAGVAPNARILPVKALDCAGIGSMSDIAAGVLWAVEQGARVVNISLGSSTDSATLAAAVRYAIARDVLVVAAVGNCGQGPTRCLGTPNLAEYPGAYPGVLGVGATTPDDTVASFSTQGPQVAITAPGVRIVSTTPTYPTSQSRQGAPMNYASFSGTSQATPLVAGVAALLMGIDPAVSASDVAARITSSADDRGVPGRDDAFGAGRLNALRAVLGTLPAVGATYDTSAAPRSVTTGASFVATVAVTNTSKTTWPATGADAVGLAYQWVDRAGTVVVGGGVTTPLAADVPPGTTTRVEARVVAPSLRGAYTLRFDLRGGAWFSERGVPPGEVPVVVASDLGARYFLAASSSTLAAMAPAVLTVTLANTGTRTWSAEGPSPVRLAYHWLRYGVVTVWDGIRAAPFAADVRPGETARVELIVVAPAEPGRYTLRVDLVQEGVRWFSDDGVEPLDIPYTVRSAYDATYAPASSSATLRRSVPEPLSVTVANTGTRPWSAGGAYPVRLSYHWVHPSGEIAVWDGARADLVADVRPGESVRVQLLVIPPPTAGVYLLRLDLVEEGLRWFSAEGVPTREVLYIVATP